MNESVHTGTILKILNRSSSERDAAQQRCSICTTLRQPAEMKARVEGWPPRRKALSVMCVDMNSGDFATAKHVRVFFFMLTERFRPLIFMLTTGCKTHFLWSKQSVLLGFVLLFTAVFTCRHERWCLPRYEPAAYWFHAHPRKTPQGHQGQRKVLWKAALKQEQWEENTCWSVKHWPFILVIMMFLFVNYLCYSYSFGYVFRCSHIFRHWFKMSQLGVNELWPTDSEAYFSASKTDVFQIIPAICHSLIYWLYYFLKRRALHVTTYSVVLVKDGV